MNNDLEQFSEESLKELIEHINQMPDANGKAQFAALARIALAAKQAKQDKPEYHIVRLELNDAWGSETVLNAYESQLDASKCKDDHGGVIIPCYTTPQPAHTEQDGWIKCSERMPEIEEDYYQTFSSAGVDISYFFEGYFADQNITHWMPLPAAPKPESE